MGIQTILRGAIRRTIGRNLGVATIGEATATGDTYTVPSGRGWAQK